MSIDLYERYMDALRRGHMALARGQLDAALAAYQEAIEAAPDRSLPRVGVGRTLLRQEAPTEALAAFDAALARAPRDEAALLGRSDALARLGRRTDAAEALDVLSETQESAGRLAEATDSARRALDLAEQKARRRRFQDLTRRLRLETGGQGAADQALAKALRTLAPEDSGGATEPTAGDGAREPETADADAEDETPTDAEGVAVDESPPPAHEEPRPDPAELVIAAETALDAGNLPAARTAYLAAAAAFDADGALNAALDACYLALAFAPADADVHLQLVQLYLELGWDVPAADKLALLGRLTELDDIQGHARARIVGLAADHFPDDPRLRRLSAHRSARP